MDDKQKQLQEIMERLNRLNQDSTEEKKAKTMADFKFWNTQPVPKTGIDFDGR